MERKNTGKENLEDSIEEAEENMSEYSKEEAEADRKAVEEIAKNYRKTIEANPDDIDHRNESGL
ncbi:MAG: hypothetical protein CVT88_03755 [Candidatus Altiarchaeales archaeon HGW-Altiarchaeales-1]|nr:MAG: hypothetical protein CVT88_03755 [Candidatus Altiarchaeales archaeon HGW-Altiarchaeales-1]